MTAESDLGTILVDGEGMTLYLFTKDTQGDGKSTCEGPCLEAWPPLVGEPTAGTGADAAKLGSIVRTDGTTQATYNGWPLYSGSRTPHLARPRDRPSTTCGGSWTPQATPSAPPEDDRDLIGGR